MLKPQKKAPALTEAQTKIPSTLLYREEYSSANIFFLSIGELLLNLAIGKYSHRQKRRCWRQLAKTLEHYYSQRAKGEQP